MKSKLPFLSRTAITVAAYTVLFAGNATCQSDDRPLQLGVTGSTSDEPTKNPTHILASTEMQQLILEIAEEPRSRAYVEERIAEEFFTLEDMVNVGLLRLEDDRYWIDFNLLLVQDQRDILDISEELGRDLAASVFEQRAAFEALANARRHPSGIHNYLFYIVVGCFALDWDGLVFTREMGYRSEAHRTIDGNSFTPWAKEKGVTVSLEGLYWGSHNEYESDVTFTTFGDHHALPRFALPDLWWNSRSDFSRYSEYEAGQEAARRLASTYPDGPWHDIGEVVLALHESDRTSAELAAQTGIEAGKVEAILELLEIAEYVERTDDKFASRVLVLTQDDRDMVRAMVSRTRDIVAEWHEVNYASVRDRLSHLTPIRSGVPFEMVYTEVWHFVFAVANRTLAERGFFSDPYAEDRTFKGFLPAVWAAGLSEGF
jgi:DNA-binding MarR family transcriptional regulator